MIVNVVTMIGAWLAISLVARAQPAPCPPGIVSMDVASIGDVNNFTNMLTCTGEGVYEVTWHGRLQIEQPIEVSELKHVTVNGVAGSSTGSASDDAVIYGGNTTMMFLVSNGSTLILNCLTLEVSTFYVHDGRAITVTSTSSLYVFDGSFKNYLASIGGAIFAHASEVYIDGNTTFDGNDNRYDYGGAIFANASKIYIDGATLFGEHIADFGGAIYADASEIYIKGATFNRNRAYDGYGGAIFADASKLCIDGATRFTYNYAWNGYGGAIFADASRLFIDGATRVAYNYAWNGYGGAIYANASDIYIDGATHFEANSAYHSHGGAIYVNATDIYIAGSTHFDHNGVSEGSGGAIYANASDIYIDGTANFDGNIAENSCGGAIYANAADIYIDGDTRFGDNVASNGSGGAVCAYDSEVSINGTTKFASNSASYLGGALYSSGGSIRVLAFSGGTEFVGNEAKRGGATSIVEPNGFNLTSVKFRSNIATDRGGAVYMAALEHASQRAYQNCSFHDNRAKNGGAAYLYADEGLDIFTSSTFNDNYASTFGGAIFLRGNLQLISSDFVGNNAGVGGLAIASLCDSSLVEIADVGFDRNAMYCPLGQYDSSDLHGAQNYASLHDFQDNYGIVCEGCGTIGNEDSREAWAYEETHVCDELPTGTIARTAGTTTETLTLAEGYYRDSEWSREVSKCPRFEACVGGDNHENYCATGYMGAYCATCSEGYSLGIGYSCSKCSREDKISTIVFISTSIVFFLLVVLILRHIRKRGAYGESRETQAASQDSVGRNTPSLVDVFIKVAPLTAIKTVVVVWQIIVQFSAVAEVVFPEAYESALSYINFVNFDIGTFVSFTCVFTPNFYEHLLLVTIAPIVALILLALKYLVAKRRYRNSRHEYLLKMKNRYLSAGLFVMFFVYSSVSTAVFQAFPQARLDGRCFLKEDYEVECGSKRHIGYTIYACCMMFAYPIGIPYFVLYWLCKNRDDLQRSDRQTVARLQPYIAVWGPYRPSLYYFEVVEYGRRLALSVSSVVFVPNSVNQIAIVLSIAGVFHFISESLSPFENDVDTGLYRWGNGVVLASMFLALLVKVDQSNDGSLSVFGWVLIIAHVLMIIAVVVEFYVLTRDWLNSLARAEPVIAPVSSPTSVCLGDNRAVHPAPTF